jgi:hypothetical protein
LGSGHLYHLLKRLQKLRTLEKYLTEKKKKHGWFFAEGYKPSGEATPNPKEAPWLTDMPWLPTESFTDDHIDPGAIATESKKLFDRNREKNKAIFEPPHALIRETSSLPVALSNRYLVFRREIIGIHAPPSQERDLSRLRRDIISHRELYKMLLLSTSGRAGVSRSTETVHKKDIMALPYPDDLSKLDLSKAEQIVCDDILNYGIEEISQGENSRASSTNLTAPALRAFGKVFCDSLNSIYKQNSNQFCALDFIESPSFICFPFAYGTPSRAKRIPQTWKTQIESGNLEPLMENIQGSGTLYKRIIKLYHQNRHLVFLIKPKLVRYWLRSTALRDASEVFTDLVSSGY